MSNFAQPLIDATDGSPEQLKRALMLSQMYWNLAITPEEKRDEFLANMKPALKMEDGESLEFKRTVVTLLCELDWAVRFAAGLAAVG